MVGCFSYSHSYTVINLTFLWHTISTEDNITRVKITIPDTSVMDKIPAHRAYPDTEINHWTGNQLVRVLTALLSKLHKLDHMNKEN
jgi:hypothetical protein